MCLHEASMFADPHEWLFIGCLHLNAGKEISKKWFKFSSTYAISKQDILSIQFCVWLSVMLDCTGKCLAPVCNINAGRLVMHRFIISKKILPSA